MSASRARPRLKLLPEKKRTASSICCMLKRKQNAPEGQLSPVVQSVPQCAASMEFITTQNVVFLLDGLNQYAQLCAG